MGATVVTETLQGGGYSICFGFASKEEGVFLKIQCLQHWIEWNEQLFLAISKDGTLKI